MGTRTVVVPGIGDVQFPDTMSDDQVVAAIKKNSMSPKFNAGAAMDTVKDAPRLAGNALRELRSGVMDGVVGAGQLVSHLGPQSFTDRYSDYMRQRESEIQGDRGYRRGKCQTRKDCRERGPRIGYGRGQYSCHAAWAHGGRSEGWGRFFLGLSR